MNIYSQKQLSSKLATARIGLMAIEGTGLWLAVTAQVAKFGTLF